MGRPTIALPAALLCAALLPAPAGAQEAPEAGSPSGTVYEIPAQQGRNEAAPRSPGGGAVATGAGGSPIRSENGFGTSGVVPGAPAGTGADTSGDPSGGDGSGARGESEPAAADGAQPAGEARLQSAATGAPSPARAFLLAGLAALVALALGAGGRLALRSRA